MVTNPLGQTVTYAEIYQPSLLCPIPRAEGRVALGLATQGELPFFGVDIWNCYEVSWLDGKGKPHVAVLEIQTPCNAEYMIESKSLKLYLNSLNGTRFNTSVEVLHTIETDLGVVARAPVMVRVMNAHKSALFLESRGVLLDDLDVEINTYTPDACLLQPAHASSTVVTESLYSHLFKTNCPVTGQPDWASIFINYQGKPMDRAGLLRYLVSFRQHQGYHEHSVERVFMDILTRLSPTRLTVYARYTRRGGIDINPFRSTYEAVPENQRVFRQ